METKTDGLLDMKQAANFLNVKVSTLYGMTMRREIPVVKIGKLNRFRMQDLQAFIESRMVNL